MVKEAPHDEPTEKSALGALAHKLDAVGWGLFFIWLGYILLADVDSGVALLGIGVIIWGGQFARLSFKLGLEVFWAVVGTGFVLGGVWQLLQAQLPLLPILLILAGVAVIFTAFLRRSHRSSIWVCCEPGEPREPFTHKRA